MAKPDWRNERTIQRCPLREWLRENMPEGSDEKDKPSGFTPEDIDLVFRWFGPKYQLDSDGKFWLIEVKHPGYRPNPAQDRLFSMIHRMLRKADPKRKRYMGYFLLEVEFDGEAPTLPKDTRTVSFPVWVNGKGMNEQEFRDWCYEYRTALKPYYKDEKSEDGNPKHLYVKETVSDKPKRHRKRRQPLKKEKTEPNQRHESTVRKRRMDRLL